MPLVLAVVVAAGCSYGIWTFVGGWLAGEEILVGGVVVVMMLVGGMLFALRCARLALREERYLLAGTSLRVSSTTLGKRRETIVERSNIEEIVQTHVPPKAPGEAGIYGTLLVLRHGSPETGKQIPLEGTSEEESDWLAAVLSDWGKIPRRSESSVE